jgi:hypothetical protein
VAVLAPMGLSIILTVIIMMFPLRKNTNRCIYCYRRKPDFLY